MTDGLKVVVVLGVQAMMAGSEVAKRATAEVWPTQAIPP